MRRKWLWASIVAAFLGLAGMGLAVAQGGDDDDGDEETTSEDAAVTGRAIADLSGPEQLAEAERIHTSANQLSQRVLGMLDEARREGDVVRATCLDDKLTQINAHLRTLGDRVESLEEAIDTGDDGRRNHEFTVVTVLGQNFSQLERDSNECIGSSLYETGTTRVTTEVDPGTTTEDPSLLPVPPVTAGGLIPPSASL
jgi:hypothetical protein